jgi:putative GTP pyrophosphokinase
MKLEPFTQYQKELVKEYAKLYPEYKKLAQELKSLIKSILNKSGIEYIDIIGRAKNITSFKDKIRRKKYKNPLFDIKDLCAIRIICSFPKEVKETENILQKNFKISAYKDQEKNISPYKFWYRSHHFEVQLSDKQITKKNYKFLKHYIAEIQVRTVFMNAWAVMEHKINYKHEWNTSHKTKRKLSRLSALLELADEQLEELSKKK